MRASTQRYVEVFGLVGGDVDHVRPEAERPVNGSTSRARGGTLGYALPALRRLVGARDHDHCRVSGEGAAVGGHRLTLAGSDYAADRLRLGQVSGGVLDARFDELLGI